MTFADALFQSALGQIRESVTVPTTSERAVNDVTGRIRQRRDLIAQYLSDVQHLTVGLEPSPLAAVVPPTRARFVALADRAVRSLDVDSYAPSVEAAVAETAQWVDGLLKTGRDTPDPDDLVRHALSVFLAKEAEPTSNDEAQS